MSQHTPTPWKAMPCSQTPDRGAVFVEGPQGWDHNPVCSTYENYERETNEANATYLVRCVNAHEELVAECVSALELVEEILEEKYGEMDAEPPRLLMLRRRLMDVLAKAKGGAA